MKYLSVCSGIEAASKAWEPIGWEPVAFSEIEPFPAAVLKHRWPKIQNLGDMTKYEQWNIPSGSVDLLVGGTPCQSFSVAGLRKGLHDPRGGLMLTFLEIAKSLRPRWVVWENVPGVLSSNGGRDFGSFLGALGELGYGWAYRVLDAQWFGVAQRRRRVFVVGCLGDGADAAKVLFESESVRRDSPPSREAGQRVAADAQEGVGISGIAGGFRMQAFGEYSEDGTASAMKARDYKDATDLAVLYENHPNDSRVTGPHEVAPSCVSRFGTGGGNVPLVQEAIAFTTEQTPKFNRDQALTLTKQSPTGGGQPQCVAVAHPQAIAFEPGIATREGSESRFVKELSPTLRKEMGDNQVAVAMRESGQGYWMEDSKAGTLRAEGENRPSRPSNVIAQSSMAVRRLSPRECERLQGFNDDHTMIPWRNKPADQCPDGPRYKALGNSMAVPCMAWIGKRIDKVDRENRKATK
jgi:DNA (cytosine-5)-methyltransferase 1